MKTVLLLFGLLTGAFVATVVADDAGQPAEAPLDFPVSEMVADFEGFEESEPGVMFQPPSYSSSTSPHIRSDFAVRVTSQFPPGNARAGLKMVKATWAFNENSPRPWLRLTTYNALLLKNPTIDGRARVRFDLYATQPLGVAMGFRETGTTAAIGEDGGIDGSIEFVGVKTSGGSAPICVREVTSGQWTVVEFDLSQAKVAPFTGDGILAPGKGVLESLIFVSAGGTGECVVYLDNFEVVHETSSVRSVEKVEGIQSRDETQPLEKGVGVELTWKAVPGVRYFILYRDEASGTTWSNLGTELSFGDDEGAFTRLEPASQTQYRVVEKNSNRLMEFTQATIDLAAGLSE